MNNRDNMGANTCFEIGRVTDKNKKGGRKWQS